MLESDDWARIGGGWDKKDRTVRERLRVVNNVGRSDGIPPHLWGAFRQPVRGRTIATQTGRDSLRSVTFATDDNNNQ